MKNNILNLKEYELPQKSFIGGWYIPKHICDGVIQYFYNNEKSTYKGFVGSFKKNAGREIRTEVKESTDLSVMPDNGDFEMELYEQYLGYCFRNYIDRYEHIDKNYHFNLNLNYNIQHYPKGGGFKKWHFERTSPALQSRRVLVFMTYLNDVDDGGTEFYYQDIKTKAEKGLTLLWPTDFTHTHRGTVSMTKEKYIVTGWYSYNETLHESLSNE